MIQSIKKNKDLSSLLNLQLTVLRFLQIHKN